MAVDKKSQHVGNHGGRYTDLQGQTKQFTYVDHDKKTKIATGLIDPNADFSDAKYRGALVSRIVNMPASICPEIFSDFTLRGEERRVVEWNTTMLIDSGIPTSQLRDLCTLLENKAEAMRLIS